MITILLLAAAVQDYYPLGEGYTWTYQAAGNPDLSESVKKVSGREKVGDHDCFVVEDTGMGGDMQKMIMSADKDGLWVRRMRREVKDPWLWLKLPLAKGNTWSSTLASPESDRTATLDFSAGDEEAVTVPAGSYKARRVTMTGAEKKTGIEIVMWFAPDVGEVKRTVKVTKKDKVEELSYQLVKFEKGK